VLPLWLRWSVGAAGADNDGTAHKCVLKGFGVEDEKRLKRELHALTRLRHPNVVPVLGVCQQRQPARWFVELPLYPRNLLQWLVARDGVAESKEDRDLAVGAVLKGVLEGLQYVHQVRVGWLVGWLVGG
jgi:serine/threonine protein kinase